MCGFASKLRLITDNFIKTYTVSTLTNWRLSCQTFWCCDISEYDKALTDWGGAGAAGSPARCSAGRGAAGRVTAAPPAPPTRSSGTPCRSRTWSAGAPPNTRHTTVRCLLITQFIEGIQYQFDYQCSENIQSGRNAYNILKLIMISGREFQVLTSRTPSQVWMPPLLFTGMVPSPDSIFVRSCPLACLQTKMQTYLL